MAKKKTPKKSPVKSLEPTDSLPTFIYAFEYDSYYLLIGGNRMKIRWNKRNIPANAPIYNLPKRIGFDSNFPTSQNMFVGQSYEYSVYIESKGEPGTIWISGDYEVIYESSNEEIVILSGGETRQDYVVTAVGIGTAKIKMTLIYPGNIRYSTSMTITVTNPVLSFDANGGTGTMDPIEADSEGKVTLPQSTFTPPEADQYAEGWDIGSDHYGAGEEITITENTVAKVHWATQK